MPPPPGMPSSMAMTITLWWRAVASGIMPASARSTPHGVEVDELETHLLGHAPHEVGFGDQVLGREDAGDALPGLVVLLEHRFHVLERDPLALDQGFGQRRERGPSPTGPRLE